MKGIIRKTGEEITIVAYGGNSNRSDVLDYVSYIDSHGVEHPREKMNLYWDVEVINEQMELCRQMAKHSISADMMAKESADKALTKREAVALAIYSSIVSGIYASGGSKYWEPKEIAEETTEYTDAFMEEFVKEE